MRPRHQRGTIERKDNVWVLRYFEDRIEDGHVKRVRTSKVLAPYSNAYRTKTQVKTLADEILASVQNAQGAGHIDGTLTLSEFVEKRHFPHLEQRLKMGGALHLEPSTLKGYRDIWKFHVKDSPLASIRMRDFKTKHAQDFLMALDHKLAHQTHLRIKAFLSGVFNRARQAGAITGVNPLDGTTTGGARKTFKGHAYSLTEISDMLTKLAEPARTVCAVAAFTGLSASELRGLKWSDYDGEFLTVNRKVWARHVGQPKTEARQGKVPIIPALKKILEQYREEFNDDFIFQGEKGFSLHLDNMSRRVIKPILGEWHGWHSFRRGIATRLFYLGVDGRTVQSIMRHANISTTMAHYVMPDPTEAKAAMEKFSKALNEVIAP